MTIGCFCPSNFKTYCRNDFANSKCCFRGKMPFIQVSIILSLLLVMAGDVEPNPGPSRKCPHCQFEIPKRRTKCEHCGLLVKSVKNNQNTGDKGGSSFRTFVQVVNVHKPNSVRNSYVFVVFEAPDTLINLHIALDRWYHHEMSDIQLTKLK